MKWEAFHHPDLSLPVVRRKAGDELITLLAGTANLILSRGASDLYGNCYPNERAFQASISRLQKKGLIVTPHTDGTLPHLKLTPEGEARLPPYYAPHHYWSKKWNQWWYVLMFDVPEKERHYRNMLRSFLKMLRFGCLQKSVWVSPWDVRPEYDDLDRAAAVDSIAFLFEARTVLGHGNQTVVQEAWNFERLNEIQSRYLTFADKNSDRLLHGKFSDAELLQLLRIDNSAFTQAMSTDPLLPAELHPKNYLGSDVFTLHQSLTRQIADRL